MRAVSNKFPDRAWIGLILIISVAVVAVVTFLLYKARGLSEVNPAIYTLPKINAFLNGSVAILLFTGYFFIRQKNRTAHRASMLAAFLFSSIFLVFYLIYHSNAPETRFGDLDHNQILSETEKLQAGSIRFLYYLLLASHILLAAVIVPMVLLSLYRIWRGEIASHRKIARWTLPIWLYVSISGVIVYLLISPYYPI